MTSAFPPFQPPRRVLLGPGPSEVPPLVLQALARPTIGHLDPEFLRLMDETRAMLRQAFGTTNALTVPMSGTGSAGMETAIVNLVEPGDKVLIGIHGVFGVRMAEVARRAGAEVREVKAAWGTPLDPDLLRREALDFGPKLIGVVHAETSTGVLLDLAPVRAICDEVGALLLADMVTSLGGLEVRVDAIPVDVAYSGTQKCLSCPPGLAPVTLSPRAEAVLVARKRPVQSWYLDLSLIREYWGESRVYHHTAPINQLYGLHEALRLVLDEGLVAREARHRKVAAMLAAGLEAMGFELLVAPEHRLPPLTTVKVPDGVDEAKVRKTMLDHYGVEIGGGLGPLKGKVWRIGLMGHAANASNVAIVVGALSASLRALGGAPACDLIEAHTAMAPFTT